MIGYHAVSADGDARFDTPFAAAMHLDELGVAGRVETETPGGDRVTVWQRTVDGAWTAVHSTKGR